MEQGDRLEGVKKILIFMGSLLILSGAGLLLYFCYTVYLVFENPEAVPVVEYLMRLIHAEGPALKGSTRVLAEHGVQEVSFEFYLSEEIRTVISIGFAALVFLVLSSIANSIIKGGSSLINGVLHKNNTSN